MPRLSDLTDYNYDPMGSAVPAELPVDKPFKDLKKVYITGDEDLPVKFSDEPVKGDSGSFSNNVDKILNSLFRPDEKRLQLWPEKLLRSGTTAAGNVMSGEIPQWAVDPATGDVHTSPQMVEAAQEMSALAGTGGLGGTGGTLNATPSLRPALKHNGKLYKGKPGQEHMDVIPESMYPDFQKKAMNGEDIKEYNFGFINDKGHFLNREDALKYGIDNGLIDPQAGKFGALTSTLFADSSKPGAAIEAMKIANPFFSALEHNVKQISQSKMTGDQWLGTLGNKPGVKPEELQWTGLQDFLNENKSKPVTKAQIEEHLAANKVELKEVNKGGEVSQSQLQEAANKFYKKEVNLDTLNPIMKQQFIDELKPKSTTKYHSYQLPGGENYREMLMTLPPGKEVFDQNLMYYMRKFPQVTKEIKTLEDVALAEKHNPAFRETMKGLSPEEVLATARASEKPATETYKSSHWDEPNILAHVRMNDRTIEGKKSLHLEEIQSDWHQQGREKGYSKKRQLTTEEQARYDDLSNSAGYRKLKPDEKIEFESLQKLNKDSNISGGVPDAPFKKSWHELALKRMLREASEKGYDRLSWTPGEAQAARYDLSKSVDSIHVKPEHGNKLVEINPKGGKQIGVYVNDKGNVVPNAGYDVHAKPYEGKALSDIVGKETADKILKLEKGELAGDNLKIGGEGMKGFYDQIIPKALEKLGKEHGVKVKQTGVDVSGGKTLNSRDHSGAFEDGVAQVHYIDIPQSLKDTATQKGFPLFSAGGYMLLPIAHNPFEDKK